MLKNRWLSLDGTVWNIPQGKATKPRGGKVWRCQRRVTTGRGPCGWGVCAPVVCGCVGGWVGGRAQHGWSKVKLEDTSDEAHPLMVAMGILLDSTVLWMSLHLSSHLDEPCCCQASWWRHKNTNIGDDNHVPSCSQRPLCPGAGKPKVQAREKGVGLSPDLYLT